MKVASYFLDWSEPCLHIGAGSIEKLPSILKSAAVKSVLFVTDEGLTKLNLTDAPISALKNENISVTVYDGVLPNPTFKNIEEARELYVKNGCGAIIAFGGGSPMDCAKVAAARVANPDRTIEEMKGLLKVRKKTPPVFAVPTTAGTGSETTLAAVVTNVKTHEKYAINDPKLRPGYAVLDPLLTVGLPPNITSTTGMDALTHAVEAYIGRGNTKKTRQFAEEAVKLIFENLETAYNDGKNVKARENMLFASFCGGAAFTRAYVGYSHAIAHKLGGLYGIPHGLANAVILPYVLDYFGKSAETALSRLSDIVGIKGADNSQKAGAFIEEIRAMNKRMNIPEHISSIKAEDIPIIAKSALKEANPLYPVPKIMNRRECEEIVKKIAG
ncbi:MAG: iron-containing alcohol dehydrogenase [Clostridiales bacterium]|jgi:alcohol dehydrogenase class IV|nr:iron-containing alcohol dehydrogenase [Clostridiales bacterium]